jgi:hypothetical protein
MKVLSIKSLYGKQVDIMEVKALMDLSNKTMSRFHLDCLRTCTYMRMSSIIEGYLPSS